MSEAAAPAVPAAARPLATAADVAFLLLMVAVTGPIAPMGIATALCGVLTLAAMRAEGRIAWPRTPVDAAAIAWLAAVVLATLFSVDRAASAARLGKGLFPLLVGLAATRVRDRATGERALAVFLFASGVVAMLSFAGWVREGASMAARARGLSGHYMTFGGQLLLELSVAFGVAATARQPRWRLGASAVAIAALAAMAATFTRSAWIGLFVACVVVFLALRPLAAIGLSLIGLSLMVYAPPMFRARLLSAFNPYDPGNHERLRIWQAGLHMFRDHPLTGVGMQDLHKLYDQYRPADAQEHVGHMHSVLIQVAASMGVVGLVAFVWLYASLLRTAATDLRARLASRGPAAGLQLGVLAALCGFFVAGFFEWNFGDEELLYPLYTLLGMAWASRHWDTDGA